MTALRFPSLRLPVLVESTSEDAHYVGDCLRTAFARWRASAVGIVGSQHFDIAILGAPYDSSVSYRPGARFGPYGIRSGSRRQGPTRGFNPSTGINPYQSGLSIIDCSDVPMSPYDPVLALDQLEVGYTTLLNRPMISTAPRRISGMSKDGKEHPRIVTLGGDHTIVLPILRSLVGIYGPISVIHLDAHLDTWDPASYLGSSSATSRTNHGSFFAITADEGLLGPSVHLGIRTRLSDLQDYVHDKEVGFDILSIQEILEIAKRRGGNNPVYISLDIDVVEPGSAPATGTPESGGLSSREVKRLIRGMGGLNIVGIDVVEVSPPFDTNAEITAMLAADLVHEFLSVVVKGDQANTTRGGRL